MTDARRLSCKPIRANLDPRLTAGDHRVLDALGAHADLRTGEVTAGSETLRSYARMGASPMTERGWLKCTDHLEELGYVVTRREGIRKRYRVLYDVREATPTSDTGTHGPVSAPEPGFREGAQHRNEGSGDTGTGVPGERVNSTTTDLKTTGAREDDRNGGSGVTGDSDKRHRTEVSGDEEVEMDPELRDLAMKLAVAVNAALRDNPATRAQSEIHLLSAGLAATPLKDWLAEGIPFDLILHACTAAARRYKPGQAGDRISRFTYFERPVREAYDKAQTREAGEVVGAASVAPVKRLRRLA